MTQDALHVNKYSAPPSFYYSSLKWYKRVWQSYKHCNQYLRDLVFKPWKGINIFLFSKMSMPYLWTTKIDGSFHGSKGLEHVDDHSPSSSIEVKNKCNNTSIHTICLQGMYRNNFTTFTINICTHLTMITNLCTFLLYLQRRCTSFRA